MKEIQGANCNHYSDNGMPQQWHTDDNYIKHDSALCDIHVLRSAHD